MSIKPSLVQLSSLLRQSQNEIWIVQNSVFRHVHSGKLCCYAFLPQLLFVILSMTSIFTLFASLPMQRALWKQM